MILADKIFMKYKILIVRHKISFMAAEKLQTVIELFLRQILKTNEALKNDGIVIEDIILKKKLQSFIDSIDNTQMSLGEAVRHLKKTDSVTISKKDLDFDKFNRNRLERKKETVEKIFGNFTAISGGQLFQADDEARQRKFQKERF